MFFFTIIKYQYLCIGLFVIKCTVPSGLTWLETVPMKFEDYSQLLVILKIDIFKAAVLLYQECLCYTPEL